MAIQAQTFRATLTRPVHHVANHVLPALRVDFALQKQGATVKSWRETWKLRCWLDCKNCCMSETRVLGDQVLCLMTMIISISLS